MQRSDLRQQPTPPQRSPGEFEASSYITLTTKRQYPTPDNQQQQQQQQTQSAPPKPTWPTYSSNEVYAPPKTLAPKKPKEKVLSSKGPRKRFNALGQEIDGKWSKDPAVIRWGIIVGIWLVISWAAQWSMFFLPYWRMDEYHHAGLFQVCGTADIQFNPTYFDSGGAGNLTIKSTHDAVCVSVEDYVNDFLVKVKPDPNRPLPSDRWYNNASGALSHILMSRWLEAFGTVFDMIFGVGTLLLIMRPAADERVEARNAAITVAGIVIMPWFPVFDILLSFSYWEIIGVGYFSKLAYVSSDSTSNFTMAGPVVSLFTSWFDFVIQIMFLSWGLMRLLGANNKKLKHIFKKSPVEEEHVMTLFPKAKSLGL
ncbi:hypothetical protein HDU79_011055 [Rhizoclosmatium sp. JEL0117]|nr:hypothetical protein HDU79_011055 [Rhizoclosmatium sp. JEL0117]